MQSWQKLRSDSLFVQATATAGWGAILAQRLGELVVQVVGHRAWDALPGEDKDDHHSVLAAVARPVAYQTQQLLLLTASPDHLQPNSRPTQPWRCPYFKKL